MKRILSAVLVGLLLMPVAWAPEAAADDAVVEAQAAEGALGLTREQRRQIQEALAARGFDVGPADGSFGPRTREAIRAWQHGYKSGVEGATGYLNTSQAQSLLEGAEAAGESRRSIRPRQSLGGGGTDGTVWLATEESGTYVCTASREDSASLENGPLSWSGRCVGGKPTGKGVAISDSADYMRMGSFVGGVPDGYWAIRDADHPSIRGAVTWVVEMLRIENKWLGPSFSIILEPDKAYQVYVRPAQRFVPHGGGLIGRFQNASAGVVLDEVDYLAVDIVTYEDGERQSLCEFYRKGQSITSAGGRGCP